MPDETPREPQSIEQDADILRRVGGWLFRRRTSIPIPIVLALIVIPPAPDPPALSTRLVAIGVLMVAAAEWLRLEAVRYIGTISRTRSDRLGPLVDAGPFAHVRNPLYIGNIALWVGFAMCARLVWLAPIIVGLLALEYHAIVRWEEGLLESRIGEPYREYMRRVPRWLPRLTASAGSVQPKGRWADALFSERGTLIAIALGYVLLWLKSAFEP